jgi:hypothetical protein
VCGCRRNGGTASCRKKFVTERKWWEEELTGASVAASVQLMRLQTF